MLAIEWIWLLIGTAVVFAHLVEVWATPYLPAVWMVGLLVLFLVYRLGMAVREVYWPEPQPSATEQRQARIEAKKQAYETDPRQSGDGIVSTTEWVPPHIRGRNVPQDRKKQPPPMPAGSAPEADKTADLLDAIQPADADKTAEQLDLPAASGRFDGSEVATVFAEVDEETEPSPTAIVAVAIPYQKTSIVRVDKSELRPETDADLSIDDLVIPSFAESALTGDERKRALEAVGDDEVTDTRTIKEPPALAAVAADAAAADDETNPIRIKDEPSGDGEGST